jgi:AraC-like DNA-binding protein
MQTVDGSPGGSTTGHSDKGPSLLWALQDVTLPVSTQPMLVRGGDLVLFDQARGYEPALRAARARMLHFDPADIVLPADRIETTGVTPIDPTSPVCNLVKKLWLIRDDMATLHDGMQGVERQLQGVIAALLTKLLSPASSSKRSRHTTATLRRAHALIAENFRDATFGPGTLADMMQVRPGYLAKLFGQIDTTTTQCIQDARLAHAKAWLSDPNRSHLSIYDIAVAAGFKDQSYFARIFKRIVDLTPREYRQRATIL